MKNLVLFLCLCLPVLATPPDRATPPPPEPVRPMVLPGVSKTSLSNGLAVWVVERHQVPVVELDLVVPAGTEKDPAQAFGLASLTSDLLTEGAAGKSALQLADELDFLGAELESGSGFDAASVSLYVPVARLEPALELMKAVVTQPDFPEAELQRRRDELLTEFLQARDDPDGLMALVFPSTLYPQGHRYANLSIGTEEVIEGLTRDQLVAFHASAYRPEGSVMIVVGDVKPDTIVPMLEKAFGGWKAMAPPPPSTDIPPAPQVQGRRVVMVDRPGAAQTVIRIARLGVDRKTPDYYALTVMNTLLGGSFTSRLNQNLREQHGYTYGARSRFDMRHQVGPFYAAANVQSDKTGAALQEFFKELESIREPVGSAELAKAKNYLAYGYPENFLSNSTFAGELEEVWAYGLEDNFFATYVDRIQAVTAEDVQRVARAYIVPESMVIVMVGDKAVIEPQLEGLDLGEIEVVTP